jgi:hypothetical protein
MLVISRSRRTISSRACVGVCFWDLHSKKLNSSSMFVFDHCSSLCYVLHCFNQETIRHTWVGEGRDILNKAGESE